MEEKRHYTVRVCPKWPKGEMQTLGSFDNRPHALKELFDFMNKEFPGQWEPESFVAPDSGRYVHVRSGGGDILLGLLEEELSPLERLRETLNQATQQIEYYKKQIEEQEGKVANLRHQINVLEELGKERR